MLKKILAGLFAFVLVGGISVVLADVAFLTMTFVYFEKDGEPYDEPIEYTVTCYGYTFMPMGPVDMPPEPGSYTPEEVYSYSATCPEYGCEIYESYYLNHRYIDYCDLTGEAEGEEFEIKNFGDWPVGKCAFDPQFDRYDGEKYYDETDEYRNCVHSGSGLDECEKYLEETSVSGMITDDGGNPFERFCETRFEMLEREEIVFSDVPEEHVNYDAVEYVKKAGIVSGYVDGTYRPDAEINRAEFTKIVMNAIWPAKFVEECEVNALDFSDVDEGDWFAPYVCKAFEEEVIKGYPDGTFMPGDPIKFVEAAKIISEALSYYRAHGEVYEVGPWYEPYVYTLQNLGAVPMTIDSLSKNVTRGEMAEMIYRLQAHVTDKESAELLQMKY